MVAARDPVGHELDGAFRDRFADRVAEVPAMASSVVGERLAAHREFVERRRADGDPPGYEATHYDFPVVTRQERQIRLYTVDDVTAVDRGYRLRHVPTEGG